MWRESNCRRLVDVRGPLDSSVWPTVRSLVILLAINELFK